MFDLHILISIHIWHHASFTYADIHASDSCPSKYKGETCQVVKTDACDGDPCWSGGTCVPSEELGSFEYQCDCADMFTGMCRRSPTNDFFLWFFCLFYYWPIVACTAFRATHFLRRRPTKLSTKTEFSADDYDSDLKVHPSHLTPDADF